jgi:hypothetical protein
MLIGGFCEGFILVSRTDEKELKVQCKLYAVGCCFVVGCGKKVMVCSVVCVCVCGKKQSKKRFPKPQNFVFYQ